ncbi:Hsp70 protein-domain-containing protein [Hyaloraphidium curvatum]|nr:Hsp70 protein-domain-containing protein [Hyaloraphidium curvatum]
MGPKQRRGTPAPDGGRSTPPVRPDTPSSAGGGAAQPALVVGASFGTDVSVLALPAPVGATSSTGVPVAPTVIANEDGDHRIPSVVAVAPHGIVTAAAARQQQAGNLANTLVRFRELLGRRIDDGEVARVARQLAPRIGPSAEDPARPAFELDVAADPDSPFAPPATMTPRDAAAHHLRRLLASAAGYAGRAPAGLVLAHPPGWAPPQLDDLRAAMADAGCPPDLSALVAEPAAALLALDALRPPAPAPPGETARVVLVADVGARHTSCALLAASPAPAGALYTVLSHRSLPLGCADLDAALAAHFAAEFVRKYRLGGPEEIGRRGMARLLLACEAAKRSLSSPGASAGVVDVESLWDGVDLRGSIARARWDALADPWIKDVGRAVVAAVEGWEEGGWEDVAEVVLIGGGSKIPRLQSHLRSLLPPALPLRLPNAEGLEPDELIAQGCALHASLLLSLAGEGGFPPAAPADHLARALAVLDGAGKPVWVLPRFAALPARVVIPVAPAEGADRLLVRLAERDGDSVRVLLEVCAGTEGWDGPGRVAVSADGKGVEVRVEGGGREVRGRAEWASA